MFDSPIAFCPKCKQMVLLDQTQRECKLEHECGDIECPLLNYFSGYDFSRTPDKNKDEPNGPG
ncbi:MAG TPA: hypothetical protein VF816_14145 [Rhodocyclaceae bacterium]